MKLQAKKRDIIGKKVKKLRLKNIIPAVLFEPRKDSINIEVSQADFLKTYKQVGETEVFDLAIENKTYPVIIEEISKHPVTSSITHVNFRIVNLKQKIKVSVPVVFINEETHPLIKSNSAILITQLDEIEVEALPNDLPKEITLDVLKLAEIGESFTIKDLKNAIDTKKVEILEDDESITVATLDYAQQQEETIEEPTSVEDIEVTSEKPKEEGTTDETPKKEEKK